MLALDIQSVRHRFGTRVALDGVSLAVAPGEVFGLLGPNGGGKTTLFRIVSTLLAPDEGSVRVFGGDVVEGAQTVRRRMGVVFQHPALDARLTVAENLTHQGHLYGLRGRGLRQRIEDVLTRVRLADRAADLVGSLSGGLQRRAEVAKALLHEPELLLMDEPSTGLDPSARRDIWTDLLRLRAERGTTVVVTTHLMDEAAGCDRVAILDRGRVVAEGAPAALTAGIGGDVVLVTARNPDTLGARIRDRFGISAEVLDGQLRIERSRGHEFVTDLVEAFPGEIDAVAFGRPTLEDVFVHHTGHRLE